MKIWHEHEMMINSNWTELVHCAWLFSFICLWMCVCVCWKVQRQLYHWHVIILKLFSECTYSQCLEISRKKSERGKTTRDNDFNFHMFSFLRMFVSIHYASHIFSVCVRARNAQEYECILFWQHKNYLKMPSMLFLARIALCVPFFSHFLCVVYFALCLRIV